MYPAFFSDGLYQPEATKLLVTPATLTSPLLPVALKTSMGFGCMGEQRSSELQRRPLVGYFTSAGLLYVHRRQVQKSPASGHTYLGLLHGSQVGAHRRRFIKQDITPAHQSLSTLWPKPFRVTRDLRVEHLIAMTHPRIHKLRPMFAWQI